MATKKKEPTTFDILFKIRGELQVEVVAATIEDALSVARSYQFSDVLENANDTIECEKPVISFIAVND